MNAPGFLSRRPVRLRLALVYSGLFLLAGTVLLAVTYGLVANSLASSVPLAVIKARQFDIAGQLPGMNACAAKAATASHIAICKQEASAEAQAIASVTASGERAQTLHHLLYTSLAALAVMAVFSAVLGWVVAGRALRPVHAITAAARRASQENLSERIALAGPADELKELADTFDAMLARLEGAFVSQRRFVANASHELRTPLTVMRTAIDVTLAKPTRTSVQLEAMAAEVRQAVERAEAMIEALLTLARSDRGQGPVSQLDLAVFAEDALDVAAPAIRATELRVTTALEPGVAIGDPVLVERLVVNLIDNSVRHNAPGGWIEVTTGDSDGMAFISVANSGPAIEESEVESLFEPFRRLCPHPGPDGGDGAGLGLSIVASVVAAHHGHVSARPYPGGGLAVHVLLPGSGL